MTLRSWPALAFLIVFGSIVAYSFYVQPITVWTLLAGAAIITSVVLIVRAEVTQPAAEPVPLRAPEREEDGATLAA